MDKSRVRVEYRRREDYSWVTESLSLAVDILSDCVEAPWLLLLAIPALPLLAWYKRQRRESQRRNNGRQVSISSGPPASNSVTLRPSGRGRWEL
jgi:hypothetical protein